MNQRTVIVLAVAVAAYVILFSDSEWADRIRTAVGKLVAGHMRP